MKPKTIGSPDIREIREAAGGVLSKNGNRLLLIEALVLSLVPLVAYSFVHTAFAAVLQLLIEKGEADGIVALVTVGFLLAMLSLTLFVTLPLLLGVLRMAWRMAEGHDVVLAELFSSFATAKTYRRSLRLSVGVFWRLGALIAVVGITCAATVAFFERLVVVGLLCGVVVLLEVAVGGMLLLRQFPCFAIAMYEDTPMRDARRIARNLTRRCRFGGILFFLHFVPHLLLGFVTFGIFLIWEVLPRMCVSYFLYCRKINDMMIQSEEYKNHE